MKQLTLVTTGTVDTVNFTGAGVTATYTGNTVNVTIPGGGTGTGTAILETVTQTTHGFTVGQDKHCGHLMFQDSIHLHKQILVIIQQ
jgi:hypothetical protein